MSETDRLPHRSPLEGPVSPADAPADGPLLVRRALVSVFDKSGLVELARGLAGLGVRLVSSGSTASVLQDAGIPVTTVAEVTGFPEMLEGRVKTLHPRVHAGILADKRKPGHLAQLEEQGIEPFDLVVVNLYPFRETVGSGAGEDEVIEKIDIGGPAMVRAAAKNFASVAVVVDPGGYEAVLDEIRRTGGLSLPTRRRLAADAFAHTAAYDAAVASWFAGQVAGEAADAWPAFRGSAYELAETLRYGENPHQSAALYVNADAAPGLAQAEQLHGKAMSYNNYVDAEAARRAAYDVDQACVAIMKHANPCGIAVSAAGDLAEAHRKAHACDPVSAYGGIIATNRPVTVAMAEQVVDIFTEVVVAPDFEPGAVEVLSKKKNVRLLRCPAPPAGGWSETREISGGLLVQTADVLDAAGDDPASWTLAAGEPADEATLADLAFAWRAIRSVKSNAILLAADGATVGVGMGQVNRVDSARLAVARAGDRAAGSVAASDAFFPFADGLQVLVDAGVRAVVQPGGSVRDEEVISAAKAARITMYLTGTRHFFH
jgi:phosphoribosylaminoimidazolecarboxamide formyltransferase / IMP cyclohydrolase